MKIFMGRLINQIQIKPILLPFLFTIVILTNSCKETELESKALDTGSNQIIVEGSLNDWDKSLFTEIDDKIKIAVCNDDKFIYFGGEFLDRNVGRLFALYGMTLIIDPAGDKQNNIEMNFYYPGTKQIDYLTGGFFQALKGDQKIKVLRKLELINNSVFVIDTSSLKSYTFNEIEDPDFQGELKITDNKLIFEAKIPIGLNKYFESFTSINEKSLFCLQPGRKPGLTFGFPMGMANKPENKKGNMQPGQREFELNEPQDIQYWFRIKMN